MTDLLIPPGFIHATLSLQHTGISHTALMTFGFAITAPPWTQTNTDDLLTALSTVIRPVHDPEVTYTRVVVLVGNDGPYGRFEDTGSLVGTRGTVEVMPPNVSYLIGKRTAVAGRRYRGRVYLPFVYEAGVNQTGALLSAEQTVLNTCATALQALPGAGIATNVASHQLLHATSPLSSTPPPTTISNHVASSFVATQRRRLERA